ncbi:unnamed protein product [Rotaria socialis]|uniref:Uncharacterized protein n=1 Tax=Rotaria socialis TaxID=392032 RepID=A0A820YX65_9BILA|nr:unnamed protein product [Rotaria socialis]CAF3480219.1 unnamed protein product [Rotaria socialis]CAF4519174.1 unnamed protein product [Rotaria socialis]CAF4552120.1 unnamed protein product [Rotaria socialis]
MLANFYGKRSSPPVLSPPTKRYRLTPPCVRPGIRPDIRPIVHNEDPYATANLANTLKQLQKEASVRQQRREQSDCVRRASILFDVFGYVVLLPRLQKKYEGALTINDWHDDVRALLERDFEQRPLSKEQQVLVQHVEKLATSIDLFTYEQWKCLLTLNLMAGASEKGDKMKIIHRCEVEKVKELATRFLEGAKQSTVLQLVSLLEDSN